MIRPTLSSAARAARPALAALFALAALTLGCEDDRAPATSATSAPPAATTAAPASAMPSAPEPTALLAEGGAPDATSAEPAPTGEPTASGPDAGAKDAGAKDAGTPKPPKDAGAATSSGPKTSAADAGSGDAGGPLVKGDAPPATPTATAAAPIPPPAPGSADEIAAQVDAIFLGKKTFKARFKQEHTQKVSGVTKKSAGTVFVEKPNKLSFRYDPPNNNRIVSDGTTLKVFISEDQQMFVQPVEKTEYPGALSFLMGNGLRPSFTFTIHDKAKFEGGPVLNGKPRAPTPYYEYVLFYVDKALLEKKDPGVMRRVLIVDAQGNRNRFDFEDVSQPASIEPSEFVFSPPPGTNIQDAKK